MREVGYRVETLVSATGFGVARVILIVQENQIPSDIHSPQEIFKRPKHASVGRHLLGPCSPL